jgi:hypothetical protein
MVTIMIVHQGPFPGITWSHSQALPGRVGCCSCELLATLSKFSIIHIYFLLYSNSLKDTIIVLIVWGQVKKRIVRGICYNETKLNINKTDHFSVFWGVSVRNIHLFCFGFSLTFLKINKLNQPIIYVHSILDYVSLS